MFELGASVLAIRDKPATRRLDPRQYPEDRDVCDSFREVTGGFLDRLRPDALSILESRFSVVGSGIHPADQIDVWWGFYLVPGLLPTLDGLVPINHIARSASPGIFVSSEGVGRLVAEMDARGGLPRGEVGSREATQIEAFLRLAAEHGLALSIG